MVRGILTLSQVLILCLTATLSFHCQAQTLTKREYSSGQEITRVRALSKNRESAATEQAQRTVAVWILTSLVNESERYNDEALRVRTQARSADALWAVDEPFARSLFLQAWRTAEKVDGAAEQSADEARKSALKSPGVMMVPPAASLRSEVLGLAARRDPVLGNIFIAKLDEEKKKESESSAQRKAVEYADPTEPRLAITKRLEVALQMLNGGDVKQAKTFAEPALAFTTSPGVIFLCALRQKDPQGADKIYERLLTRAGSNPESEATTVSLLSSYVLTPNYIVTATRRGRVSNQFGDPTEGHTTPPELLARFFSVAATILLRPPQAPDQDSTLAGPAGTYFTIARLLPMFETYAPAYLPALNAQLAMLAQDAPQTFRNGQETMLTIGLVSEASKGNSIAEILDQVASAPNSAERDLLYVKAIRESVTNGDARIRQFSEKIEDENLRDRARSFTDLEVIRKMIGQGDINAALAIVRSGYLVSLHRVWSMGKLARLLRNTDSAAAMQLLEDANAEAHRIDMGDADRVYALSCVAAAFFEVDRSRSWNVAADAVKAANGIPGFTGEDGRLFARLRTRNVISIISADEPSFNIANVFKLLAKDDLQLALSTADGLTGDASRTAVTLAVARSILDKQKTRGSKG